MVRMRGKQCRRKKAMTKKTRHLKTLKMGLKMEMTHRRFQLTKSTENGEQS
jgi:hypothetical protein